MYCPSEFHSFSNYINADNLELKKKLKTKLRGFLVRVRTMPIERPPLLGEVVPTFGDRGCCVVSATDPSGR
jgi:hypothetical protein